MYAFVVQRADILGPFGHGVHHLIVEILAARVSFRADRLEADRVKFPRYCSTRHRLRRSIGPTRSVWRPRHL